MRGKISSFVLGLLFALSFTATAQVGIPRFVQNLTVRGTLTLPSGSTLSLASGSTLSSSSTDAQFNSLGLGQAATGVAGEFQGTGNVNTSLSALITNSSNGTANSARFQATSGDASVGLFAAGSGRTSAVLTNGPTGAQGVLRTLGDYPLIFGQNNTAAFRTSSTGSRLNLISLDSVGDAYMGFYQSDNTTRKGYLGFGDAASDLMYFANEVNNAGIYIATTGTSAVLSLAAPTIQGTVAAVDMTPASGTFTATFDDACTTSPTIVFDYQRIGNIVVLGTQSSTGFTCTGDSTNFKTTGTPVPSALRPARIFVSQPQGGCTDNGTAFACAFQVDTDGNVEMCRAASSVQVCVGTGGWTGSGARGAPSMATNNYTFSYMLGNP